MSAGMSAGRVSAGQRHSGMLWWRAGRQCLRVAYSPCGLSRSLPRSLAPPTGFGGVTHSSCRARRETGIALSLAGSKQSLAAAHRKSRRCRTPPSWPAPRQARRGPACARQADLHAVSGAVLGPVQGVEADGGLDAPRLAHVAHIARAAARLGLKPTQPDVAPAGPLDATHRRGLQVLGATRMVGAVQKQKIAAYAQRIGPISQQHTPLRLPGLLLWGPLRRPGPPSKTGLWPGPCRRSRSR